jgi:hypothetical protein
MKMNFLLCCTGLACALLAAGTARADERHREVCVPMMALQGNNSPAIDDQTIVLELSGNKYKRVDLENRCPDVVFRGFSYDAPTQELCTSETLHVNESAGATCIIKDIVDITPAEAKALLRKR